MLVLESNLNDKKYPKEALKCCFKKNIKDLKEKKLCSQIQDHMDMVMISTRLSKKFHCSTKNLQYKI